MTGATLLTIIGSLGVPTIAASLIAYFGSRATLRASKPKTEAEADQVQASAAVQNLNAQAAVITTLVQENARLTAKANDLEARLSAGEGNSSELRAALDQARRDLARVSAALRKAEEWIAHAWAEGPSMDDPPPAEFVA